MVARPRRRPPRPLALSFELPHQEQFIVLSEGLLHALDASQAQAVVRHEAAHLRSRHQRLRTLASVPEQALGWLPP